MFDPAYLVRNNKHFPMSNTHEISLGIFDINGTIQDKNGVPKEVIEGFKAMGRNGLRTTIATGRGVSRAKELLGDALHTVVSPGMPISVENGSRLATLDGKNIAHHTLSPDVRKSSLDIIDSERDDIEFVAHYPQDNRRGISLWTPNGEVPMSFTQRHGSFGEIYTDSVSDLDARVEADKAGMLIIKPRDTELAAAFTGANVEINEAELNVLNENVDKGRGVQDIAEYVGVPLREVLVAGNDHNDIPMFTQLVGEKLFVGDNEISFPPGAFLRFSTPALLGNYLKTANY